MAASQANLESTTRENDSLAGTSASVSPNSVSDRPAREDSLGFTPYVQAVAAFLTHPATQPPLTMSVEGPWGSGKSSFMLQLETEFKEAGHKTVWFDAWRHDQEDELWAAFALDFTNKLSASLPFWKRWLLHFKLSLLRFDWRRGWLRLGKFIGLAAIFVFLSIEISRYLFGLNSPIQHLISSVQSQTSGGTKDQGFKPEELSLQLLLGAGGSVAYIAIAFLLLRTLGELVGNPLEIPLGEYIRDPKYEARGTFLEAFHSDFERLIQIYSEGRRIFVFVDDLDRCEVPKSAEIIQAINLLISDSAPVFYILGLDREKIVAGLAAKYEKLLPYLSSSAKRSPGVTGTEFGYDYLEKFIQIPFLLPRPAAEDVEKLLDSLGPPVRARAEQVKEQQKIEAGLLVELSNDSPAVRRIVEMVAPSFDYNPRRLKQFLNLFRLRALLASQTGLFGQPRNPDLFDTMTLIQLAKLVAIGLRWPMLLTDLERESALLKKLEESETLSTDSPRGSRPKGSLERYWLAKPELMRLIRCSQSGTDEVFTSSLARVDVQRFLQVAPSVPGREITGTQTSVRVQESSLSYEHTNHFAGQQAEAYAADPKIVPTQGSSFSNIGFIETMEGSPTTPDRSAADDSAHIFEHTEPASERRSDDPNVMRSQVVTDPKPSSEDYRGYQGDSGTRMRLNRSNLKKPPGSKSTKKK
jgi:hypothetical protein